MDAWRLTLASHSARIRRASMAIPHRHSVGMALPVMIERNGPIYLGPAPDAIAAIQESLDSGRNGVIEDGGLTSHRISLICDGRRQKRRYALCPYGECDTGVTQD